MNLLNKFFRLKDAHTSHTEEIDKNSDEIVDISPAYSKPIYESLLIGEIILLDWCNNKREDARFPNYFATYGINWINSREKLLTNHYLRYATTNEKLAVLLKKELEEILANNNLKKSGKKDELVQRIIINLDEHQYSKYVEFKVFKLTELGEQALKKCDILVWSHKLSSGSRLLLPYNMANFIDSDEPYEQIAIRLLLEDVYSKLANGDVLNASYSLEQRIYIEMKYKLDDLALHDILIDSVLFLSGLEWNDFFYSQINSERFYQKDNLINLQYSLGVSNEELINKVSTIFDSTDKLLPRIKLYKSKREFLKGFDLLLNGTMDEFDALTSHWRSRLPDDEL